MNTEVKFTMPDIDLLMITWNRAAYTARTLECLLETLTPRTRLWIWHNGDHQPTMRVVRSFESHPRVHCVHWSATNVRLREPTNWFWSQATAPYVGKIDDDCLMPRGWLETIIAAHESDPKLGIISAWPFREEDHCPEQAARKLRAVGPELSVMMNPWTGGSGYLVKRACQEAMGPLGADEPFSRWCMRAARAGWINGWIYPFLYMDHMDDPRSAYTQLRSESDFNRNMPLSAVEKNIESLESIRERVTRHAHYLQSCSPDVRSHRGLRRRLTTLRARCARLLGSDTAWTH